jgi:hypothetical protein
MAADERSRGGLTPVVLALVFALAAAADARAGTSIIPIPEIITDPNEGNTFGLMGVVLFTNDKDEIQYMLAPDVQYNKTKGTFPSFRFFGYPTPTRRYSIVIGKSTTKDQDYEFEYADRGLMEGRAFFLAKAVYEWDSTERFFGLGNDSHENPVLRRRRGGYDPTCVPPGATDPVPDGAHPSTFCQTGGESNYTSDDLDIRMTPGYWLLPSLQASYRMQIKRFSISHGQVSGVPFIGDLHPDVPGLDTGFYWAHQFALTFDTRDSIDIPTHGAYANLYTELADRRLGSSTSFVKFGGEWKDFIPFRRTNNPTLALHAIADWLSGDRDTPFWEQSSLGGHRVLRGFGGDRFIDFNRSLMGAELRTRVYERHLFGVNLEVELAPFVEAGEVFRHLSDSPVDDLHWVGGLGFRGVVRPQIVGFVDIGRGSEGTSVFTGIDYPF